MFHLVNDNRETIMKTMTDFGKLILAGGLALTLSATSSLADQVNIYGWADEYPQKTLDAFTEETGIEVIFDTFDSNETLIAKLEAGASGYDLLGPSQYAVQILAKKDLIVEVDHSKIANYKNIKPVFQNVSYDPGLKWHIPVFWGTTGLAYNKSCVKEPVTSWTALWDKKYEGRIYMLDNMLAAYIAGLQVNGFSANSSDKAEIEQATQSLLEQKPILAGYNSTNFADLISSGEACLVESWSGSVIGAMNSNPDVVFVLPDEGGTMWIDGLAIAKDAPNLENAYKFISYILQPEVAAEMTELSSVATTVEGSKELLPPAVANNTAIFPPDDKLANADFILDVGEAMKYYQDGWTKVKAAQ